MNIVREMPELAAEDFRVLVRVEGDVTTIFQDVPLSYLEGYLESLDDEAEDLGRDPLIIDGAGASQTAVAIFRKAVRSERDHDTACIAALWVCLFAHAFPPGPLEWDDLLKVRGHGFIKILVSSDYQRWSFTTGSLDGDIDYSVSGRRVVPFDETWSGQ